ncbi:bacillithiol system redox-active protein YtxJ [Fulvivirga sp. RKSG066]|uniref:bacillithiol system redox-active protein YtxJ n=1 Tax=Fulvivirga aurantia TaxID=2529383 RepID=UPI0012BB6021|nr:bacillithiol system redox-active protein YtxJ [Fulvivirga aurantia]MTI21990.1 bacillithiol system redox-active protein YtxJ [Fulvivirga aurantia]
MNWNQLQSNDLLDKIKEESKSQPVLIFKHSTRCSISSMALNRLERSWDESEMEGLKPYYLDLISYRNISDQIASDFGVEHASPQVIVIKDGAAVYDNSHMGISYEELQEFAKN